MCHASGGVKVHFKHFRHCATFLNFFDEMLIKRRLQLLYHYEGYLERKIDEINIKLLSDSQKQLSVK